MNSLGAGGAQSPWLVNGANALTFGLMVITATLTPVLIRFLGVKWSLFFGAAGYAPYAAALYCNIVSARWMVARRFASREFTWDIHEVSRLGQNGLFCSAQLCAVSLLVCETEFWYVSMAHANAVCDNRGILGGERDL